MEIKGQNKGNKIKIYKFLDTYLERTADGQTG